MNLNSIPRYVTEFCVQSTSVSTDTVSHVKLLYCLQYYGIDGCLLNWIKKLSLRSHSHHPSWECSLRATDLCSGTIQGSGIGPLLFIAYINELADVLSEYKVTIKFFADDLKSVSYTHLTLPTIYSV